MDGIRHGKETSEMPIAELSSLIEKIVLLIGQTNITCLYESRVSYMANILRSLKVAKSTLAKNPSHRAHPVQESRRRVEQLGGTVTRPGARPLGEVHTLEA